MKSFYISPKTYVSQELLRTCLLLFITRRLRKYEGLVFPMIPYVNDIRFSNQTPQAFRMMFGVDGENVSDDVVMRSVYGPLAILKTTGFHPSTGFKVFPFSPELETIRNLLKKMLAEDVLPEEFASLDVDFNFMEIKIYKGADIFQDEAGEPFLDSHNNPVRVDSNKSVGLHNDLNFSDDGTQSTNDTARADCPIVTFNLGAVRELTFVFKNKKKGGVWNNCPKESRKVFRLADGSMFVLLSPDEIPTLIEELLFKTQHMAQFKDEGMSIGFVFRGVRGKSFFNKNTNEWLWNLDDNYKVQVRQYLKRTSKQYKTVRTTPGHQSINTAIKKNMLQFLGQLWTKKFNK